MTAPLTHDEIDGWCEEGSPAMALHVREVLLPVEGRGAVVFPPTYIGGKYNIDRLEDGTKVVTLDSVGSQANRIEPAFGQPALAGLVPLHRIFYRGPEGTAENEKPSITLLDAGHRLADASIRSVPDLARRARMAFEDFNRKPSDATNLARLGPTSILFGVWDSRETQAKLPRMVQSVIRGWNVSELRRSATYFPPIKPEETGAFDNEALGEAKEKAKAGGDGKNPLSKVGFLEAPSGETHGGVVVHGDIVRDVSVNLVALRRLQGQDESALRRYILGLSLVAATIEQDLFLRAGCLLVGDAEHPLAVHLVTRDGRRTPVALGHDAAVAYARRAAEAFGVSAGEDFEFDGKAAQRLVAAEGGEAGPKARRGRGKAAEA